MFIFFFYAMFCVPFLSCRLPFGLLVQLVFDPVMTDSLYSSTPALSYLLLDLNLNMNLNPETMVHNDMYNVKYRQTDTLYEPVLLKQIRVSCAVFKVTSSVDWAVFGSSELFRKKLLDN